MERGGRASKLGNSYERLWAVRQALEVIDGRARSLIWEALGDDGNGIDLWVTDSDGKRIGYQVKCQNHSKEIWSVSDLRTRGVLQYARDQLDRDINANYVFVSSCGVRDLKDLAEMSRRTDGDSQAFHRDIVSVSSERNRAFLTLTRIFHE